MTRMEEYTALRAELAREPEKLETFVSRALKRRNAYRKKMRAWVASGASMAACFAAFVLLVNLSVPFARACGGVPVLRELARAVAWSPSLSAAVENEYVQPIDQTRTADGVTASVEYVIVDRRQVSIFYTLTAQPDRPLDADAKISGAQGAALDGFSSSSGSYGTPNGQLRQVDVSFVDRDVPPALDLTLDVYENRWQEAEKQAAAPQDEDPFSTSERPKYLASLTFTHLRPLFYGAGRDGGGKSDLSTGRPDADAQDRGDLSHAPAAGLRLRAGEHRVAHRVGILCGGRTGEPIRAGDQRDLRQRGGSFAIHGHVLDGHHVFQ